MTQAPLRHSYASMTRVAMLVMAIIALAVAMVMQAQAARGETARGETAQTPEAITLFLAASLQPVTSALLEQNPNFEVRLVPASSGLLARQIALGAPSDIYITADPKWSAWLKGKSVKVIEARPILSNRLALIASASSGVKLQAVKNTELTPDGVRTLLQNAKRIAVGDPVHVPVGGYAQQIFDKLGLIDSSFSQRLIPLINTRATMLHVERGEADIGIVYRSDALFVRKASLLGLVPASLHNPIRYDVLLLTERAREFYDFLARSKARANFSSFGFTPL